MAVEYYIDVESPVAAAAGPLSLTALVCPNGLDLKALKERDRDLIYYLDELEASKELYVVHTYLWPEQLNGQGFTQLIRKRVDATIARLSFSSRVRAKNIYRLSSNIPTSTNYLLQPLYKPCPYRKLISRINQWKRRQLINTHYKYLYPEYELPKNLGYKTPRHLDLIYMYGPRIDFHHHSALTDLPKHWAKKLINMTPGYLCTTTDPTPSWWYSYVKEPFTSFIPAKDKQLVKSLVTGQLRVSPTFKQFITDNQPLILTQSKKSTALPQPETYETTYLSAETK